MVLRQMLLSGLVDKDLDSGWNCDEYLDHVARWKRGVSVNKFVTRLDTLPSLVFTK